MSRLRVCVVVPAFNEGPALAAVLTEVEVALEALRARYEIELHIVDDGSIDETPEVIGTFARAHPENVRVTTHPVNRGLTEALKTGARAVRDGAVVFLDADLSYAPDIVGRLLEALQTRNAAAVLASPYMRGGRVGNVPVDRLLASRVANFLLAACVGFRLHTFTGMVRAYDAATLRTILSRPERGEFNAWVVAELLRERKRVVEIPAALVWPRARFEAPSRMTRAKLWARTRLVITTIGVLLAAGRTEPAGSVA